MRGGLVLLVGSMLALAMFDPGLGLPGTGQEMAAPARSKKAPRPLRKKQVQPAPRSPDKHDAEATPSGFLSPRSAVYSQSFTPASETRSYGRFPSRINPLVSQEFPATPEYTYLYTPSSVLTTAPAAMSYRYAADNRFLLTPASGVRAIAEAYSWKRSWIHQAAAAGMSSQVYRYQNRPSVSRDPGKKIDNTLSPDGLSREALGSELNAALRNLRLPTVLGPSP